METLFSLQTSIFIVISPNVNWHNPSHWPQFKSPFKKTFQQVHISATSSDIGKQKENINKPNLIGGAAIITTDLWVSKVNETIQDPRGHSTYTKTTYRGKNGRKLTIIGAYISVSKGTSAGEHTLYNQQITLMRSWQSKTALFGTPINAQNVKP